MTQGKPPSPISRRVSLTVPRHPDDPEKLRELRESAEDRDRKLGRHLRGRQARCRSSRRRLTGVVEAVQSVARAGTRTRPSTAPARIGGILSGVFGVDGHKILDGLAQGTEREVILASLTGHVADELAGLGEALALGPGDNDRFMPDDLLEEHDAPDVGIASCTQKIDERSVPREEQLRRLTTVPGVGGIAASTILVGTGPDLEGFASRRHVAAWAGLCPGHHESGGRRRNARPRRSFRILRATLVECAHEPRDGSSRPTTAPSPPGAATSASSSPVRARCCAWRGEGLRSPDFDRYRRSCRNSAP